MPIKITSADPRFDTLKRSRNLRWPANETEYAEEIELCDTAEQVAESLQRIVHAGMRPTVRSGGHCYEDFVVNNPGGAILDLSLLVADHLSGDGDRLRISPGQQLGQVYQDLYKKHGVAIPAGSCYTVGAGGHIAGGGYGVMSRLHGLTVDWLSAVEVLTVDGKGRVSMRRVDERHEPDLFRACRGGGGGNFGVMTGFLFDRLPPAPEEVVGGQLSFDWKDMSEDKFTSILQAFGDYFDGRGRDQDTWGLFAILELTHASSGRFGMGLQFCNVDGRCDDLKLLAEFLDRFEGLGYIPQPARPESAGQRAAAKSDAAYALERRHGLQRRSWLEATIGDGGGGESGRAKYKSCYMKKNFTREECACIYRQLTQNRPGVDQRGFVLAVDSYGGAVNDRRLVGKTSITQRSSIMKLQFQQYWGRSEEDAARLQWMRDFYTELYSIHVDAPYKGTPYPNDRYEGCYINYPDRDMLDYDFWTQLYWGSGELYPFLQEVKRHYDPNNIFHHAMSVRA